MPLAIKSVKQSFIPTEKVVKLMTTFRQMVNHCIRIGLENNASTLKRLSKLAYAELARYDIISYYKLCAISRAAGILSNRKKSLKRRREPRQPYATRPLLLSCYGFKVVNGILRAPLGNAEYFDIPLTVMSEGSYLILQSKFVLLH
ncbi:MAG: hypothetical protein ACREBU_16685 [Nitrososphaera sp.]